MIVSGIFTLIGYAVIKNVFGFHSFISLVLALGISVFFTLKIFGGQPKRTIIQGIVVIVSIFSVFTIFSYLFSIITPYTNEDVSFVKEESVSRTTLIEDRDTVTVYRSNRVWKDNYGNNYAGDLTVREQDFYNLKGHINSYRPPGGGNFWGNLYDYIDRKDTPSLDLVIKTFESINAEKKLNQMEFAEMVVSCIQDIPYSFVFQEECMPAQHYEESIRQILEKCPDCCIGNIMYGIQNPVSFIQNLKGDCDTRTVIIYAILKHFNYDVAILNSDFYKHSILGINLPASGLNKVYNGKKYILWETTAKYFEAGYLSPGFNDVTYWNVVLTSK